jgi:hypothetical protein
MFTTHSITNYVSSVRNDRRENAGKTPVKKGAKMDRTNVRIASITFSLMGTLDVETPETLTALAMAQPVDQIAVKMPETVLSAGEGKDADAAQRVEYWTRAQVAGLIRTRYALDGTTRKSAKRTTKTAAEKRAETSSPVPSTNGTHA